MFKAKSYSEALARRKQGKRGKRRSGIRIDPADRFFSLYIRWRAGWRCERCGTQYPIGAQGLHCSHFYSRGRESTRFDEENASAHCFGCHAELGGNPEIHREWKLQRMGEEAYMKLRIRAEMRCKKDRVGQAMYWKLRLKQEYPDAKV